MIVAGRECPADQWTRLQRGKEARGYGRALHLLRHALVTADVHNEGPEQGGILKGTIVLLPHQVVANAQGAKRKIAREKAHEDYGHAIGVGVRQRAQQDSVGHAEHRGIGANAEGQHEHGDNSERGVSAQSAGAVAEILREVFHPVDAARVAACLFVLRNRPQGPQRGVARLFRGQSGVSSFLNLAFKMILQFLIEILLDLAAAKQRPQEKAKLYQPTRHMVSLSGTDDQRNSCRKPLPLKRFFGQRLSPGMRESVVFGAAIVLRDLPLGLDPALLLQFVKRRVKRALSHLQRVFRHLANALGNGPAVHGLHGENRQDQQVQGALQEKSWLAHECISCALASVTDISY